MHIADINARDISGNLPYSRAVSAIGFAVALESSKVISLDKKILQGK